MKVQLFKLLSKSTSGLGVYGSSSSKVLEGKPWERKQAKTVLRIFVIILNLEPCRHGFTKGINYMCWDFILFKVLSLDP